MTAAPVAAQNIHYVRKHRQANYLRLPCITAGMCALPSIFSVTQRDVIGGFSLS